MFVFNCTHHFNKLIIIRRLWCVQSDVLTTKYIETNNIFMFDCHNTLLSQSCH